MDVQELQSSQSVQQIDGQGDVLLHTFDNTLKKAAVADGAFRTPHTYRVLGEVLKVGRCRWKLILVFSKLCLLARGALFGV